MNPGKSVRADAAAMNGDLRDSGLRDSDLRDSDGLARAIGLAGALAIVLGAKLWLIALYGSSTPFWDQWAEPNQIYRPYLTGELHLGDLLAAHNEHRILLTRLVALGLFIVEGRWDPIAQTLVNAIIHVLAIGVFIVLVGRTLDAARLWLLAMLAALAFALPFGWGNTLVGFQTQFYLLVLLGPLTLWLLAPSAAFTPRWWLGTLFGLASYFTIASGALTLPAFVALAAIQLATGARRGRGELLGLLVHIVLAAAMILDIPRLPPAGGLPANSAQSWIEALSVAASWPIAKAGWPVLLRALTAVGLYLPVIVLAARLLRRRAAIGDRLWLVVAIAGWVVLQMLSFIYGRGVTVLQSRYMDVLLLGPLVNAAALLCLQRDGAAPRLRAATAVTCIWLAALVIGLGQKALSYIPADLAWRRETTAAQTENLKRYLATGDVSALADKPLFHIPFPSADYLRDTVSDPIIRAILPPDLLGQPEPEQKLKRIAMRQGPLLMPIGLALLMIAALLAMAGLPRRAGSP
jgi:hypothetical protein